MSYFYHKVKNDNIPAALMLVSKSPFEGKERGHCLSHIITILPSVSFLKANTARSV